MKPIKVLEHYIVTFNLPDPGFKQEAEAGRELKDKGCTQFEKHREWSPSADVFQMTIHGYITES